MALDPEYAAELADLAVVRKEIISGKDALMEHAAGVFDVVRSLNHAVGLRRIGNVTAIPSFDSLQDSVLSTEYENYDVLATLSVRGLAMDGKSIHLARSSLLTLALGYFDDPAPGATHELALPAPRPDYIRLSRWLLAIPESQVEMKVGTTPRETVVGGTRLVIGPGLAQYFLSPQRAFGPVQQVLYPQLDGDDEHSWPVFRSLPVGGFATQAIDFQRENLRVAVSLTDELEECALDPTLNPRVPYAGE